MINGIAVANMIGKDPAIVYKTLVTAAKSKRYYVFVLPVTCELDLKKAAKSVGEKKVEMIAVKDIEHVTGYIKGGCSPIGMKKQYPTIFDISAKALPNMVFNGGKVGIQVELRPSDINIAIRCTFEDICMR